MTHTNPLAAYITKVGSHHYAWTFAGKDSRVFATKREALMNLTTFVDDLRLLSAVRQMTQEAR